jgi:uracil phosphoribosyltransferase
MSESSWQSPRHEHRYGPNVQLLRDPVFELMLARLCQPEMVQPQFNATIRTLYRRMMQVVLAEQVEWNPVFSPTRMSESAGVDLSFSAPRDRPRVVCVDVARAGMLPASECFDVACGVLHPDDVRCDHIMMSRQTDDSQHVTHSAIGGTRIGGDVDGRLVVLPDPMGATGTSLSTTISLYKDQVDGNASRYVAMHLIVTPEYIRRVLHDHPDAVIYAWRLDRGMSAADVIATVPGTFAERESGLDAHDYIVPGGGGFGELINNAWI